MELFNSDGHLTQAGLGVLVDNGLSEMGRLEAAEHLSFCDACLDAYTALLAGESLMKPERSIHKPVMRRIRRRGGRVLWARYGTVAAAACLAVVMFGAGVLLPRLGRNGAGAWRNVAEDSARAGGYAAAEEASAPGLGQRISDALGEAGGGVGALWGGLFAGVGAKPPELAGAGAGAQVQGSPVQAVEAAWQQQAEQQRKEREKVFDRMKDFD